MSSTPFNKQLKTAFFSALLVLAVAYPVLGLKLTTVGIGLEVHGASPTTLTIIFGAAALMFVWQLVRDRIPMPRRTRGTHTSPLIKLGTQLT